MEFDKKSWREGRGGRRGGRQDVVGLSKTFPRNIPWQLRDHDPMACCMRFVLTFYIMLKEKRFLLVGGEMWQDITWLDIEMRVLNTETTV